VVRDHPFFSLTRCVQAAREGRLGLGKSRCRDLLLPLLEESLRCDAFALAVVEALGPGDFSKNVILSGGEKYDEYAIRLSPDILDSFGLVHESWYVKFTIRAGTWGEETYCLSLHPLEHPMECLKGRLVPSIRDLP
jgi:hypothetical protein